MLKVYDIVEKISLFSTPKAIGNLIMALADVSPNAYRKILNNRMETSRGDFLSRVLYKN